MAKQTKTKNVDIFQGIASAALCETVMANLAAIMNMANQARLISNAGFKLYVKSKFNELEAFNNNFYCYNKDYPSWRNILIIEKEILDLLGLATTIENRDQVNCLVYTIKGDFHRNNGTELPLMEANRDMWYYQLGCHIRNSKKD